MHDVDDVRRALGYGKINLEGGSYGTRAELTYINFYGANVRSAFLTGLFPIAFRSPLYHAGVRPSMRSTPLPPIADNNLSARRHIRI